MTWATATPPPSPAPTSAMTPAAPVWAAGEQNDSADKEKQQVDDTYRATKGFAAIIESASFNARGEAFATSNVFAEKHGFAVVSLSSSMAYVQLIHDRSHRYDVRWNKSGTIRQRDTATLLCCCPYTIACRDSPEDGAGASRLRRPSTTIRHRPCPRCTHRCAFSAQPT